jgi:5-methylthioadenosine/S-adenosylhomocysteine deaminase
LFAEMQVARRMLASQGAPITAPDLVHMVTAGGARIAGLEPFLGRLGAGRPADILVLERRQEDPYESVCQANRGSVELVVIAGRLLYGRDEWFSTLAPQSDVQDGLHLHATGELVWA